MNRRPSPEDLLVRVADRDSEAMGELYDRLGPGLLGMLMRMLGDRDAAEEVLEETLARFSTEARRITRAGASVSVALALAARERALERRRSKGNSDRRAAGHVDRRISLFLPKADEVALLEERRGLLVKVLNQLPRAQREALEMLVFDGLAETAIARKLNEPPARVRAGIVASLGFLRHRVGAVLRTWTAAI